MRGGADVGTFVHGLLEACDFAADDLDESARGNGPLWGGPGKGRQRDEQEH